MKKVLLFFLIVVIILLIVWWWRSCKDKETPPPWQSYIKVDSSYVPSDTTQQIVVWRKPGGGDNFLNYWLDAIHKAAVKKSPSNSEFHITVFCGTCADSNLLLIEGPGIRTFIQGSGGKGGGSPCTSPPTMPNCNGPHGGGDTIYWCINFPVELKDSTNFDNDTFPNVRVNGKLRQRPPFNPAGSGVHDTITVAVFDTGIDTTEANNSYPYTNNTPSCLSPLLANNGWNFPEKSDMVADDYTAVSRVGHGQVVAHLIAEQVQLYQQNNIKILPVKIHNSQGQSDLFSVLCGMTYAKERGAQIINASFGYYALKKPGISAVEDSAALLIKEYIKHYLIDSSDVGKSILLIAAAGNGDTKSNDAYERKLYTDAGLTPPSNMRDLDQVNFYPASLAADPELPNVIAVTTVWDALDSVSPNQNFSKSIVDIGVNANLNLNNDFWFSNTKMPASFVRGSSYATPIVAGIICANYNRIKTFIPEKDKILNTLLNDPFIGNRHNANNKIRMGVMFDRAH